MRGGRATSCPGRAKRDPGPSAKNAKHTIETVFEPPLGPGSRYARPGHAQSRRASGAGRRDAGHHRLGDLVLAHHHLGSAVLLQMLDLGLGMSAGDDREAGVEGARLCHHLPAFECIRNGHEQAAGSGQVRRADHLRIGSVAGDRLLPGALQRGGAIRVILDHQQRRAWRQRGADEAADPSMTDQHQVVSQACDRQHGTRRGFLRRYSRGVFVSLGEPPVERDEEQRID